MGSYLSIITLNVNGLNAPTKRQRLAEWVQKQNPYLCCLQETTSKQGDTNRLKVKGWKKIFHANRDQKKAGVAILSSAAQLCPTLCDPMNRSMLDLPVHHQLPEFTQTLVHRVSNVIHPSHPLLSPSPPPFNLSQNHGLFK